MNITQAKQTVEANLAAGKFLLSDLPVAGENIPQFLSQLPPALQFTTENSIVRVEDSTLKVAHTVPGNWDVTGISTGTLRGTVITLDLAVGESVLQPKIALSGALQIPELQRTVGITAALSNSESWMIDFSICPEHLPGLFEIASLLGITGLPENLAKLKITWQMVTAARFGFDISKSSFTYIGVDGGICFGNSMLNVVCMFTPDLVIDGKIPDGEQIQLPDLLASLHLDPTNFPPVQIADLAFSCHPVSQSYSFKIGLEGDWPLGDPFLTLTQVGTEFSYASDATTAVMTGKLMLDTSLLVLEARLEEENWKFSGGTAEDSTVKLRSVINAFLPGALEMPSEVPDMGCKDVALTFVPATGAFSFKANSAEPWKIPVGVDGLNVSNINLSIDRTQEQDNKSKVAGNIGGTLNIGASGFTATYNFPGDFVVSGNIPSFKLSPLVQNFCDMDTVTGISIPPGVLDIELKDMAFRIAPQKREIAFSAASDFGKAELQVKRTTGGTWGFTVGFVPPEQWKFSEIDSSLAVLDNLRFSDTALILASGDDKSFDLATIDTPRKAVAIKSGLNLFATLSMAGLGVDELLNIDSLTVYSAIGGDLRSLTLEAQIIGEFTIAKNVAFGDIKFSLQIEPKKFDVMLLGRVSAILDSSELKFIGGLGIQVTPPSFKAHMVATMAGSWQDPFGAKGIAISEVALDLGIAFPPITPAIGIAGGLKIGEFTGMAAVNFDLANPRNSMVAIAFNRLYLIDIFNTFCPPEVKQVIPADITKTVLDVGFEDVKIYIVPQPTRIGELYFDQGIELQGKMSLWGLHAFGFLKIDQTRGILVQGDVDVIDIGGVFKLTGAGGKPNASLSLDLRTGAAPKIEIYGGVQLLGIRSDTILQVSDKEFYFLTTGKIFDLFEASLEVRGGDLTKGETIFVEAAMRNDLFDYLREKATEAIEAAASDAIRQLSAAQGTLTNAQNKVNGLQSEIDRAKARIEQLNSEIAAKQRWFDNSQWYEKAYRWAVLSAYATARYAEIGALYAEIGALEAAKHVAFGVLEVAKWALELVKATVGVAAEAGKFIAELGLGGLIDIREARFRGYLNATSGGRVSLAVSLTFMNRPQDFAFDFNFNDPLSGAKDLAQKLLSA